MGSVFGCDDVISGKCELDGWSTAAMATVQHSTGSTNECLAKHTQSERYQ